MSDGLVHADGATKDLALLGIVDGLVQGLATDPDGFGGEDNPLGVESIEQAVETLAHFADHIGFLDGKVVDEEFVGVDRVAPAFIDRADLDVVRIEIGQEERHSLERLLALIAWCGPRQEQAFGSLLRLGVPDLLAVHDPALAVAPGKGANSRGVGARIVFGHPKRNMKFAARGGGKSSTFEFLRSVVDHRPHPEDRNM